MDAFIFSGQGAQNTNMGLSLCEKDEAARAVFEEASEIMGEDLFELVRRDKAVLSQTQYAQPLTFAVDIAAMYALVNRGVAPSMCAGFSLGEYAALVCAGVLPFEPALKLVMKRGELMAACTGGAMLAVMGMPADELKALCEATSDRLWPVNYNSPKQTVVAGEEAAIAALEAELKARRIRGSRLAVSGAFHSPMMRPAADALARELAKLTFKAPRIPLVLNLTAEAATPETDFAKTLEAHCVSPVLWAQSVVKLHEMGASRFIECGHGGVLTGLVKRTLDGADAICVSDGESLEAAAGNV